MLMRFYLGFAVGHTYTHDLQHPIVSEEPEISPEHEDIDLIYTPDQDQEGSSGSDFDLESTDSGDDDMDIDEDST
jgi:hypothetical protein